MIHLSKSQAQRMAKKLGIVDDFGDTRLRPLVLGIVEKLEAAKAPRKPRKPRGAKRVPKPVTEE